MADFEDFDISASLPAKVDKNVPPMDPGETALFRLLRSGLFQKAEVSLRKLGQMPAGLGVNAQEETWSWGLLHFAAHKGEAGLMEWLLKQKARPDIPDLEGNTPLVLCAKSNHVQAMEMLMARGASIAQRTKEQGFTPLLWAAVGGHKEVTKSLLQAQADVEEQDYDDRTPLIWASRLGHMGVVKILLKECPDLTWRDKEGLTALDHCREHLELRAAVVLAQEQYTRLMEGAQRNDVQAVGHLLEHGAVPRYRDASGWTPLHWAVLHEASEMSKLLVRYGASPELLGEESELCSQLASRGRRVGTKLSKILGANTQLLAAAEAADLASARQAVEDGACPDARQGVDGGGGGQAPRGGPLSLLARQEEILQGAEVAAEMGAEPRGEGSGRNMTAMMWAARHGLADMVRLLGTANADVNLRDSRGWTAALWGSLRGDAETISVLYHFKADLLQRSWEGDSPMHLTVRCDFAAALQCLLAADASIEERSIQGQTPLHVAAACGSTKCLLVLLHYGAKVAFKDKLDRTAILIAACGVSPKACEILTAARLPDLPELPIRLPEKENPVIQEEPGSELTEEMLDQASRSKGLLGAKGRSGAGKTVPKSPTRSSVLRQDSSTRRPSLTNRTRSKARQATNASASNFMAEMPEDPTEASRPGSRKNSVTQVSLTGSRKNSWETGSVTLGLSMSLGFRRPSRGEASATGTRTLSSTDEASNDGRSFSTKEDMAFKEEVAPFGRELLILAAERRQNKLSKAAHGGGNKVLLDTGDKGMTVLHYAVAAGRTAGHFRVLSKLVELKANCNAKEKNGRTPLMQAAAVGYTEAVERMLRDSSTKVADKDKGGRTAADHAASQHIQMMIERAMVQDRTGQPRQSLDFQDRSPVFQTDAADKEDAVFRVRMEKLPTRMSAEALENKIQVLLKKVVVRPVHMEVVMDPIMGRPRGHCYLDFLDSQSSEKALELDGLEVAGSRIRMFRDVALAMVR